MAVYPGFVPESLPAWRVEMVVLGEGQAQQETAAALMAAARRSIEAATPPTAHLRPLLLQPAPFPFMGEALVIGLDIQCENGVLAWRNAHHMRSWSTLHHHHPHACVIFVYRQRLVASEPGFQTIMHVRVHPPVPVGRGQGVEVGLSARELKPYGLGCEHGPVAWSPSHLSSLLLAAGPDVQADLQAAVAFLREQHLARTLVEPSGQDAERPRL